MLLPDLEQLALFQSLQFTELMTSPTNLPILAHNLNSFVCPTNTYARTAMVIVQEPEIQTFDLPAAFLHPPPPRLYNMAKSDYAGVSGNADLAPQPDSGNGLLFRNSSVRFRDLADGTSQTLLLGERQVSERIRKDFSGNDLNYVDLTVWAGTLPWCSDSLCARRWFLQPDSRIRDPRVPGLLQSAPRQYLLRPRRWLRPANLQQHRPEYLSGTRHPRRQ
jgi:hypothetical protein